MFGYACAKTERTVRASWLFDPFKMTTTDTSGNGEPSVQIPGCNSSTNEAVKAAGAGPKDCEGARVGSPTACASLPTRASSTTCKAGLNEKSPNVCVEANVVEATVNGDVQRAHAKSQTKSTKKSATNMLLHTCFSFTHGE